MHEQDFRLVNEDGGIERLSGREDEDQAATN